MSWCLEFEKRLQMGWSVFFVRMFITKCDIILVQFPSVGGNLKKKGTKTNIAQNVREISHWTNWVSDDCAHSH